MLELLLGDDEGPSPVKTADRTRFERALAVPRAITFVALLVPFTVFAFTMTALFGAGSDRHY